MLDTYNDLVEEIDVKKGARGQFTIYLDDMASGGHKMIYNKTKTEGKLLKKEQILELIKEEI